MAKSVVRDQLRKKRPARRVNLTEAEWSKWKEKNPVGRKKALTDEDEVNIVEAIMYGAPVSYLAVKYGVSKSVIYRINKAEVKKHPRLVELQEFLDNENKEDAK